MEKTYFFNSCIKGPIINHVDIGEAESWTKICNKKKTSYEYYSALKWNVD